MVRINLMKLSSTFLLFCVLIEFWAALIAAQKFNFDASIKKQIQQKLLMMFGMKNAPVIKSDSPIAKSISKNLYEMYYSTNSFLDYSNTVRMFVHNESEIDTRFDSLHKFRLYFNLTTIPKNEVLKVSELILKSTNSKTRQNDDNDDDQVYVFIYDILEPGSKQKKLVKKLITKKKLQLNRENSFKFDISSTVKRWMNDHKSNHGILVKTYDISSNNLNKLTKSTGKIRLKRSANYEDKDNLKKPLTHEQPILVTFTDDNSELGISGKSPMGRKEKPEKTTASTTMTPDSTSTSAKIPLPSQSMTSTMHNTTSHSHNKRRNRNKRNPLKHRKKSNRNEGACRRRNLYVPFSEVGWNNWIVAPTGVEIFYCSGSCDYPLDQHFNTTNHAIVQTMINTINPSVIPKSCCVPTSLAPLSLLYVEDESKVVLRNYQNMQVLGCGCL